MIPGRSGIGQANDWTLILVGGVLLVAAVAGAVVVGFPGDDPSPYGNGTTATTPAETSPTVSTTRTTTTTAARPTTTTVASTSTGTSGSASTTTTSATGSTASTTTTATTTASSPDISFEVVAVESCGVACRDVTAELTNEGSAPATDVTADVTLYAGDERLWHDESAVGTLEPGETYTETDRIDLSLNEVGAIRANDGVVTIEMVVRYDQGTERFTHQENVL